MARHFATKREIKSRLSTILRDPATTAEQFLQAISKADRYFPEWSRRRKQRKFDDVNEMVKRLESQAKGKLQ